MTPEQRLDELASAVKTAFADKGCSLSRYAGELTLVVPVDALAGVAQQLRDDAAFQFEELIDVCGVDYSAYGKSEWATQDVSATGFGRGVDTRDAPDVDAPERFAVVYHLLSLARNVRLRLRCFVDTDQPIVPSVMDVWASANWFEREAFDLFGIMFDGHPDLRRILTDYGFIGHPFRKDFPLIGRVQMRYDPERRRVVYEPVSIEPRTLVPRVIRDDNRYSKDTTDTSGTNDA